MEDKIKVVAGDSVIFRKVSNIVGYDEVGLVNGMQYKVHAVSSMGLDIKVGASKGGTWYVTNNEQKWAGMELVREIQPVSFKELETRTVTGILKDAKAEGDTRYLKPKKDPVADEAAIDKAIQENPIYKELSDLLHGAQRKQVAYGLDKYIETLNVNSWETVETLDHIIGEGVDWLHYHIMLKMQVIAALKAQEVDDNAPRGNER